VLNNYVKLLCQIIMSVEKKEDATYELILNTAKNLFFKEGKFNATTQEIADDAGVNRTLINYYFRSRNALFDLVLKEAQKEEKEKRKMILLQNLPFKEKLERFMDYYFQNAREYPYKEIYIVTQLNQRDLYYADDDEYRSKLLEEFHLEIETEMKKGNIQKMKPIHFLINFISLLSFPTGMRPLFQQGLEISDQQYEQILSERKEVILKTIFKNY
jgi:TetR/AcrR family transcriptional regulator